MNAQAQMNNSETKMQEISSIGEALAVLDTAAKKSKSDIQGMLKDDYKDLKATFSEVEPSVRNAISSIGDQSLSMFNDAKSKTADMTKEAIDKVDHQVKENPWMYIGGAAALGGALGYYLSRKSKS